LGASSQTTRKTRSSVRAPYETGEAEPETTQRGEFIDVDAIPSPHVEPTSPTPVEEESQPPVMAGMDIDSQDSAQGRQAEDAGNPQRPARVEGAHRENGATMVQTEVVMPETTTQSRVCATTGGSGGRHYRPARLYHRRETDGGWDLK
jgi:hypothetical protein